MASIKKWFQKLKSDKKFKEVGPGHRLSEESVSSGRREYPVGESSKSAASSRANATVDARRAAAAAVARMENQRQNRKEPNWSLAAIRAQAQKELELELQAEKKIAEGPKEVYRESAPILAVNGVFYSCALVGPYVLPLREMKAKIKEFLYNQLEEERGLTACLIIHTCNKNKEKVNQAIETVEKYFTNIMENPTEEKFRKIRIKNRIFQEKVASVEGTYDFLLAAGFQNATEDGEEFLVFPEEKLGDIEFLATLLDAMKSAYPIVPELDRNVRVLMPSQAAAQMSLPKEFFILTTEEIRREQEQKSDDVEMNMMLRTKAMRERDAIKELRRYRFTLLRIKFPDGIILQGTFTVTEKLSAVMNFIQHHLANPEQTFRLHAPTGETLSEVDSSLLDLKLVPAAILNLAFEDGPNKSEDAFLKSETMALLESI